MKTRLIPIGNFSGIQIPQPFIEQCGLTKRVEMGVRDSTILIREPMTSKGRDDPTRGLCKFQNVEGQK